MAQLAQDRHAASAIARFGMDARYGDLAIPIQAIDFPDAQAVGVGGFIEVRHEIYILKSDIEMPERDDVIEIYGNYYEVQFIEPDGEMWRLIVRRGGQ